MGDDVLLLDEDRIPFFFAGGDVDAIYAGVAERLLFLGVFLDHYCTGRCDDIYVVLYITWIPLWDFGHDFGYALRP